MDIELANTSQIAALPDAWKAAAGAWLLKVEKRSGSQRTPQEYARYIGRFLASLPDPAQVTPAHVHAFVYGAGPSDNPPSASTVNVRLAALRGFFDFAVAMGMLAQNPAAKVEGSRSEDPRPRGLEKEELKALLKAIPDTEAGARDRSLIMTAIYTGLRRAELLALRVGDLEHKGGRVYYSVRTKGGHDRYRELPNPAYLEIEKALEKKGTPLESLPEEAQLFAISSHGFYKNLKSYAKRAGLKDVTPHVLRHSAAKLRRATGSSIEDVGTFLGHRSLHTTSRYLARLEGEQDNGWQAVANELGD